MPYRLRLPQALAQAGWKVKIHDRERLEPPHVTIYRKMDRWRLSLRDGRFLDRGHKWSQIDEGVRQAIADHWDEMHPDKPVQSEHDEQSNSTQ